MITNNAIKEKINYFNELGPNWNEIVGNDKKRLNVLRRVFDMIDLREHDVILDVGCGNGVLFHLIQEKIGESGKLLALDPSKSMLAKARELHLNYSNIEYINMPVENADFENEYFDLVLCFAVFPHIDDKKNVLAIFDRIIKKAGKLYIFHLSDTESLNKFHSSLNAPVRGDIMPDRNEFELLLTNTSFKIINYIDRPDLNFIECESC